MRDLHILLPVPNDLKWGCPLVIAKNTMQTTHTVPLTLRWRRWVNPFYVHLILNIKSECCSLSSPPHLSWHPNISWCVMFPAARSVTWSPLGPSHRRPTCAHIDHEGEFYTAVFNTCCCGRAITLGPRLVEGECEQVYTYKKKSHQPRTDNCIYAWNSDLEGFCLDFFNQRTTTNNAV